VVVRRRGLYGGCMCMLSVRGVDMSAWVPSLCDWRISCENATVHALLDCYSRMTGRLVRPICTWDRFARPHSSRPPDQPRIMADAPLPISVHRNPCIPWSRGYSTAGQCTASATAPGWPRRGPWTRATHARTGGPGIYRQRGSYLEDT